MRHTISIFIYAAIILTGCLNFTAQALSADFFPHESVLSTGRWVKIRVSETGMQQITYSQLAEWGFSDPSKVTVFGCGSAIYARDIIDSTLGGDLPQQPVIYLDDKLVFFGESNVRAAYYFPGNNIRCGSQPVRNTASDAGYYFLTDSRTPVEPEEIPFDNPAGATIDYHNSIQFFEEELTSPNNAGQRYFGHSLGSNETLTLTFPMPDRCLTSPLGDYVIMSPVLIAAPTATTFKFSAPRTISSVTDTYEGTATLRTPSDPKVNLYISEIKRYEWQMAAEVTSLDYTLARGNTSTDFAALDYFSFYYPRYNRLADNLSLTLTYNDILATNTIAISDATADTRVWNVDQASCVRPYETSFDAANNTLKFSPATDYKVSATDIYGMRAIAFDPAKEHNSVEFVGEIANQNLHGLEAPNLLIISSDLCYEQALRLAEIHRTRLEQTVEVVRQQEIFNEFSSGTPSPAAYRHFAKMLYERGQYKFQHILLFGGGSYDNRAILPQTQFNHNAGALLMTYGTDNHSYIGTTSQSFCADSYFGFLDDSYSPAGIYTAQQTVNVGRIPATDLSKATAAVDKIESYLTNLPSVDFNHRALLLADAGDYNVYLDYEEIAAEELAKYSLGITTIKGYDALYPWENKSAVALRECITNALQSGVGYFNYSGHGTASAISAQSIWNIAYTNATDYDYYPYAMFASCDIYNFDRGTDNLAQAMLFKKNGGMIGIIAAARSVYGSLNQKFNVNVATAYARATEMSTTGDIFRVARNNTVSERETDLSVNTLCYNFCGDPALPVYAATNNIIITSVNGQTYNSENGSHPISAFAQNTVEGYLTRSGMPDAKFTGSIIATLYEAPKQATTHTLATTDTERTITLDEDIIVEAVGKVVNGRFSVTFTPPAQMREGDYNRLTLYAISDDLKRFSKTHTTSLSMKYADEAATTDNEPPVISDLYIDSTDFVDGDVVGGDFRLYATILPDASGLKTSSSSIGGTTRVTIDNSRMITVRGTAMSTDPDGTVHISLPINSVTDGAHQLTLTTSDNIGNSASQSINFIVINRPTEASLAVAEKPARTEATISLTHTLPEEPTGRIVIEDTSGAHIYSRDAVTFPFSWDLTGADGQLVADGVYSAYAILNSGSQYGSTPKVEIIVVQEQ